MDDLIGMDEPHYSGWVLTLSENKREAGIKFKQILEDKVKAGKYDRIKNSLLEPEKYDSSWDKVVKLEQESKQLKEELSRNVYVECGKVIKENKELKEKWKNHGKWLDDTGCKLLMETIDELEREIKQLKEDELLDEDDIKECAKSLGLELRRTDNLLGENIQLKEKLDKVREIVSLEGMLSEDRELYFKLVKALSEET